MNSKSSLKSGKRWNWFGVIGASVGFIAFGVALLPGLVSREPTPAPLTHESRTLDRSASTAVDRRDSNVGSLATSPLAANSGNISPYFDCMISANETIDIGSSILATIESIEVERSDFVEAGQVLVSLESRVEEAAVRVARARAERTVEIESTRVSLKLGEQRRARAVDLYHGKSLSLELREEIETETALAELGVEEALTNRRLLKLQLKQAEAVLDRRTIRSPISGFVVERLMAPGEVVDNETILRVSQTDPLRVDVILPTQLFGSVAPGDEMEILPEAPLDKARISTVSIVDRVLDGASGTFGVRLLLPNPNHELPGGLRCQARLLPAGDRQDASDHARADPPRR